MEKKNKVFADGLIFKRNDNAPAFVIGKLSVKVEDAIGFFNANAKNGWVNLNINQGQSGKYYIELDTWEATGKPTFKSDTSQEISNISNISNTSNLPF